MSDSEYALLARFEAREDTTEEVAQFLEDALADARAEEGTTTWFAVRFDDTQFGIFDTAPDEAGRQAHVDGDIAEALFGRVTEELLVGEPTVEMADVVAAKHP
jgi:hypothetical protein